MSMSDSSQDEKLINLTYLKENISDELDFINELLGLFKVSNVEDMQTLNNSVRDSSYDSIKKMAHKMKSSFMSLGMQRTAELLIQLENLAKEEADVDSIQPVMDKVNKDFAQIIEEIDTLLGQ